MQWIKLVLTSSIIVIMWIAVGLINDLAYVPTTVLTKPRLIFSVYQYVVCVEIEIFAGISNSVHSPSYKRREKVLLTEDIVHQHTEMMLFVVIYRDTYYTFF